MLSTVSQVVAGVVEVEATTVTLLVSEVVEVLVHVSMATVVVTEDSVLLIESVALVVGQGVVITVDMAGTVST